MRGVTGLHHVTAISGPAQENVDFYAGVLGMRLVKRSVNQDDPGTYHLFYADAEGHPGTDLTFFPWTQVAPGREGHGLSVEVSLALPPGSLGYWETRLARYGAAMERIQTRFGHRVLPLRDPHGQRLALVESPEAAARTFTPWHRSPVPVGHQIRGLEGARLWERDAAGSAAFLTGSLGFRRIAADGDWQRFGVGGGTSGQYIDLREVSGVPRGAWGVGSIHHIAWRVEDDQHQLEVRRSVEEAGRQPTPVIDRFWFKSVYFREPGGVLFELATDGPGFGVDEDPARLGEALVLPPWLEPHRSAIETMLPRLGEPAPVAVK